jgi:PAS domain S-box-containing protein
MGLSEREQRLQFLGLTARDEQLLRALRPVLERHMERIVDGFYDHLLSFPETARLLEQRTTVERLKKLQREYLVRITDGRFDDAYFEERRRIGRTHERVGLSPRWYLLAYNRLFGLIAPLVHEHYADEPRRAAETVVALEKVFMLDASLAMEAYIESDRFRHLQQLESIVNDSADVIFMLDNEKRFRTWNRAAERVFGWRAEEILGQPITVLMPPEVIAAGEVERIDREIEARGHYKFETVRLAKDGRRVPVEVTVSLLRDMQGRPMGRSAILRDISERKRLEEEKLQAERLAVIGAMSAKLAHEIRNPLSSIRLNVELVRDEIEALAPKGGAADAEARSLLDSIESELRRIQRVTEEYLQFARLPRVRRQRVMLNEMLTQGLSFMRSLFEAARVTVRTELDPSIPPLWGDEEQLWQAMLNLIRNALEAMPEGGTLSVRTARDAHATLISVADTGKGMTEQERSQIFMPFFSTKTGGTGLGLPLAQQIIHEHGGRIECSSQPGCGTTFTIRLPHPAES